MKKEKNRLIFGYAKGVVLGLGVSFFWYDSGLGISPSLDLEKDKAFEIFEKR